LTKNGTKAIRLNSNFLMGHGIRRLLIMTMKYYIRLHDTINFSLFFFSKKHCKKFSEPTDIKAL
jgi:hypothetical protein